MFGQAKTPKSQKPENVPLYFYNPHNRKPLTGYNSFWQQDYRQIATFDIGYDNLARRISRRYLSPQRIETFVYEKIPISLETDEEGYRVLFNELQAWLDREKDKYFSTHVVIIEWQLPQNYKAVRISTFILSYFLMVLKDAPLLPFIVEMRSGFKDDYYPELKPLNQNARKAKCVELGIDLLKLQGDTFSLDILEGGTSKKKKTKRDDYADLVLMEEVFCRYGSEQGFDFPHYSSKVTPLPEPTQRSQSLEDYMKGQTKKKIIRLKEKDVKTSKEH